MSSRLTLLTVVIVTGVSCAAGVSQINYLSRPERPANCQLDVYQPKTEVPNPYSIVSEVSLKDTGLSTDCDSTRMMSVFRERACAVGADAIQFYDIQSPDVSTVHGYVINTCASGSARFIAYDDNPPVGSVPGAADDVKPQKQ